MTRLRGIAAIAALLGASSAALAQEVVTGSLRRSNGPVSVPHEGQIRGAEARDVEDRFASCVVDRHYASARKALVLTPGSDAQYKALHNIFDDSCWSMQGPGGSDATDIEMTTSPVLFRSSIFKALLRKDWARTVLVPSPTPPPQMTQASNVVKFADCIVRVNPAGSQRFALAEAGSKAENEALAALRDGLSQCLRPGDQVSLTKPALSAALAEAYYVEAEASRSASSK